jgi:hypothetical protein
MMNISSISRGFLPRFGMLNPNNENKSKEINVFFQFILKEIENKTDPKEKIDVRKLATVYKEKNKHVSSSAQELVVAVNEKLAEINQREKLTQQTNNRDTLNLSNKSNKS